MKAFDYYLDMRVICLSWLGDFKFVVVRNLDKEI